MNDPRKIYLLKYVSDCLSITDPSNNVIKDFLEGSQMVTNNNKLNWFLDGFISTIGFDEILVLMFRKTVVVTELLYKYPIQIKKKVQKKKLWVKKEPIPATV